MFEIFDTIKGIDGDTYVIKQGKLIKITKAIFSENWHKNTGGWCEIYLEDGNMYRIGSK